MYQSAYIDKDQTKVPAQQFTFEVPAGCLCIVGMNLYFTKKQRNLQVPMNDKSFNPAAICGAIITPGTFSLPKEINPLTGKGPNQWLLLDKLKF